MTSTSVYEVAQQHRGAVVAAAAAAPLAACAVLAVVRYSVTNTTAALLLVLIVVMAATTGLRLAGIVAAASSGLWFDVLLTRPYGQLTIHDSNDIEATVLLILIGTAVTEVALWGHRQQARSSRRAGYLEGVLGAAEIISLRHEAPELLITQVSSQISEVLGVNDCRYVAGPVVDPRTVVLGHQGTVTRRNRQIDVDHHGLPTDGEIALLVSRGDHVLGHFLLNAADRITRPSLEQRRVAVLLADQVAALVTTHGD